MFDQPRRERMLNVPAAIVALLVVLGVVQAVLMFVLTRSRRPSFCCCSPSSPRVTIPACS